MILVCVLRTKTIWAQGAFVVAAETVGPLSAPFAYPNPVALQTPVPITPKLSSKQAFDMEQLVQGLIEASNATHDYADVAAGNLTRLPEYPFLYRMSPNQHVNAFIQGLLRGSRHFR